MNNLTLQQMEILFQDWKDRYALDSEPNYCELTEFDCKAAYFDAIKTILKLVGETNDK